MEKLSIIAQSWIGSRSTLKNSAVRDSELLALLTRKWVQIHGLAKNHESGMIFSGFLILFDPPKPNILETITGLRNLGVALKIITGDNHLVAANVSQTDGIEEYKDSDRTRHFSHLSDDALLRRVGGVDVFAEIEPNQKERIILALKKAGNVVGYMGDGINDASALTCCRCRYFC